MDVRLERQFNMLVIDFELIGRLHVSDHVFENLDLVNTNLDSLAQPLIRLVCLFVPTVAHDLLETVSELRVRYQYVLNKALDFLAQIAGELVACVQYFLVQALRI